MGLRLKTVMTKFRGTAELGTRRLLLLPKEHGFSIDFKKPPYKASGGMCLARDKATGVTANLDIAGRVACSPATAHVFGIQHTAR